MTIARTTACARRAQPPAGSQKSRGFDRIVPGGDGHEAGVLGCKAGRCTRLLFLPCNFDPCGAFNPLGETISPTPWSKQPSFAAMCSLPAPPKKRWPM